MSSSQVEVAVARGRKAVDMLKRQGAVYGMYGGKPTIMEHLQRV